MLRMLIFIGAVAAAAVSVPLVHEANPQFFASLGLGTGARPQPEREVLVPVIRAAPKEEAGGTDLLPGRRVRIPMDDTGHFSGEFRLNGRSLRSLIDTGATLVAINQSTARHIGLKLSMADFKYRVNTANGTARAAAVRIDRLEIGRIRATDVDAIVLEDRALDSTLIGMSFLKHLSEYRVEGEYLYLEQ
jgi:aspartyl protease family protein